MFLSDRAANMIISGGVNIYPAEIEQELIDHPAVADVAVFGIPDDEWGEQVKAAVELAAGFEPSDELEAELLTFARSALAGYKVPRSVDFEDELPRHPTGKLYTRLLRAKYWEGRAPRSDSVRLGGGGEADGELLEAAHEVGGAAARARRRVGDGEVGEPRRGAGRASRRSRGGPGWRRGRSGGRSRRPRARWACGPRRSGTDRRTRPRRGWPTGRAASARRPPRPSGRRSSTSRVAVRTMFLIGVTQRSISSTARGPHARVRRERGPTGRGGASSWWTPPEITWRVVSSPPMRMSSDSCTISSAVRRSPSTSACTRMLIRSSRGLAWRSAITSWA